MKMRAGIGLLLLLAGSMLTNKARAQWAVENITIGQSMATTDQEALPAQFAVTLPKDKPANFLVNLGLGVNLKIPGAPKLLSAITAEYHRNTLTDSVQNNLQLGYKGSWNFHTGPGKKTDFLFVFDPQYSHDQVARKHSLQSNLLFTWVDNLKGFNWGAANVNVAKTNYTEVSLIGGSQVQDIFHSDSSASLRGLKIRPLIIASAALYFIRKQDVTDPVMSLNLGYTQRVAVVNTTSDPEKYTHLFRAGVNYYLTNQPAKVSIGGSFLTGSDPFTGLKQQQYFLLTFNVFLKKS